MHARVRVRRGDVICARDGYPLLAELRKRRRGEVRASIVPWSDGLGVLRAVEDFIRSLPPPAQGVDAAASSVMRALRGGAMACAGALG